MVQWTVLYLFSLSFSISFLIVKCNNFTDDNNRTEIIEYFKSKNGLFHFFYPYHNLTIDEIILLEEETWHFYPYKTAEYFRNISTCEETTPPVNDRLFTEEQLLNGAITLHFFAIIYLFTLVTVVCNDYFLPSVECICEDLNITQDVAAATFMATATTIPEFFTNTISTFLTESDLGIGTIVGSLMFNTLGVAALSGLFAPKPIQLDWWPISRDCFLYSINLSILIIFAWDGLIYWYEAMVFVILYILYFMIMFKSRVIKQVVKKYMEREWRICKIKSYDMNNGLHDREDDNSHNNTMKTETEIFTITKPVPAEPELHQHELVMDENLPVKVRKSLWKIPERSRLKTFWWFYVWPIKFLLTCTIPSPKTYRKLYPLSFFLCILWIGGNAFVIVECIVVIGKLFSIPDSIMGFTFLAFGGCMPEAISAVIVARRGDPGLGVSNSIGSNSLAILFSLGFPWFIRTLVDGGSTTSAFINIESYGIEFIILSLLLTVILLYAVIALVGYRLKKNVGVILFCIYFVFITMAILVELGFIIPSGKC